MIGRRGFNTQAPTLKRTLGTSSSTPLRPKKHALKALKPFAALALRLSLHFNLLHSLAHPLSHSESVFFFLLLSRQR